jgi:hypothetical protein
MVAKTFKVRLSPSGRVLGDPPLLTGTGSIGRVWRRHGAGTATTIPNVTAHTAIPGLDAITVDIRLCHHDADQLDRILSPAQCVDVRMGLVGPHEHGLSLNAGRCDCLERPRLVLRCGNGAVGYRNLQRDRVRPRTNRRLGRYYPAGICVRARH